MMMSWSISGVPRMIQTTVRVKSERGLKRDMEPKAMISPSGIAPIRVIKKSFSVCRKPALSD